MSYPQRRRRKSYGGRRSFGNPRMPLKYVGPAMQAKTALRMVKKLNKEIEVKHSYCAIDSHLVCSTNQTWTGDFLNKVAQGNTDATRIGRKITSKGWAIRASIYDNADPANTAVKPTVLRIIIGYERKHLATDTTMATIIPKVILGGNVASHVNITALYNTAAENAGNYQIVHDKIYNIRPEPTWEGTSVLPMNTRARSVNFKLYFPQNWKSEYTGAQATDFATGTWFIMACPDGDSTECYVYWQTQIKFVDA